MKIFKQVVALAILIPLVGSCVIDDQLGAPPLPTSGELMRRYVAVGNSITAGFQSAGINDSTQRQSYAVFFAAAAGTPFTIPALNNPGCPGPFINNVTMQRVGGGGATDCALRTEDPLPPFVNNVAVPAAHVIDAINNLAPNSNSNALTTFILGGQTQAEAMARANPTLVSVWIGNNDVLGALTSSTNPGDPTELTPQAQFEQEYNTLLDAIGATGGSAIILSVAQVTVIPYASAGATYWCLSTGLCPGVPAAGFPPNFTVDVSCAPSAAVPTSQGENILVPWTIGIVKILTAAQGLAQTLDCTLDTEVVTPAELAGMIAAVDGYNTFLQQAASTRGYAYFDVNPALLQEVANGTIPPFPNIPADPLTSPVTFGPLFTLDGVHPSGAAHRIVADSVISTVNQFFGTTISFVQ